MYWKMFLCLHAVRSINNKQPQVDIYKCQQHEGSDCFSFQSSDAKKDKPTAKNNGSHKSTCKGISKISA